MECVALGMDSFDSVYPTQTARHGTMFTFGGKIDILSARYKDDKGPIEKGCRCYTCKTYSRAYLRHLLKLNEPSGKRYATIHNLYFMGELMRRLRSSIRGGRFGPFRKKIVKAYRKDKNSKKSVGVNVKQ